MTVGAGKSALNLTALIGGTAVGNTWMPSAQGSDSSGHYTTAMTITGPAAGLERARSRWARAWWSSDGRRRSRAHLFRSLISMQACPASRASPSAMSLRDVVAQVVEVLADDEQQRADPSSRLPRAAWSRWMSRATSSGLSKEVGLRRCARNCSVPPPSIHVVQKTGSSGLECADEAHGLEVLRGRWRGHLPPPRADRGRRGARPGRALLARGTMRDARRMC